MRILAIDPGTEKSAYCMMTETPSVISAADVDNDTVLRLVEEGDYDQMVIECMEARNLSTAGQAIGRSTYETCIWIGRYMQVAMQRGKPIMRVYRSEEKSLLIPTKKNRLPPLPEGIGNTTDAKIRASLIARFAKHDKKNGKGTRHDKDVFYGFQGDMWAAFAVGVTGLVKIRKGGAENG